MDIYIPSFENECEIELYFLMNIFIKSNIIGLFKISQISEGVTIINHSKEIKINSYENYFSIKLKFNLSKLFDNEIATFEFKINNLSKKIKLFQKNQSIKYIDLKLNGIEKDLNDINNIEKNSLLISPFACWGKGEFLYRECYFNNKRNLELEIPDNANLYYLTNEGYLEKEKGDNYLIIIQIGEKWYSLIGFENYISYSNFKIILMTKTNNLFEELIKYFPKDCQYINTNLFEKTIEIINDRNNVLNLINNNENVHIFQIKEVIIILIKIIIFLHHPN